MLERIAAWITIVTGPLTVLTTVGAWWGRLDRVPKGYSPDSPVPDILAFLAILSAWCFLFLLQLRVFVALRNTLSDSAMFLSSILVGLIVLALFVAVEMLILDALVPKSRAPIVQLGWLIVPVGVWLIAGYFSILLIGADDFKRDA